MDGEAYFKYPFSGTDTGTRSGGAPGNARSGPTTSSGPSKPKWFHGWGAEKLNDNQQFTLLLM